MPILLRPFLLLSLLLIFSSSFSQSLPFSKYQTILSLSHSLASRVATLRESRGDHDGASRARSMAHNLERGLGLGFYKIAWNMGWNYVKNYAWRNMLSFENLGTLSSDMTELLGSLAELTRVNSDAERVAWFGRNYNKVIRVSKSLFGRLLEVFRQPGPLREVVETLQKEVVEGDLVRDCLELGGNDLNDLIRLLKDVALQYTTASSRSDL
ncbi:unnamed protein product [Fraxinus pennsylvanica]|uniref:Uncharacterized protein n=1 Tax=Fraxinus pennsylvanica TaxID=56036 RepID=A0AAD2DHW9_9LAMI|nr:unnamed protein product [Fraxinus pennsylvanica]